MYISVVMRTLTTCLSLLASKCIGMKMNRSSDGIKCIPV